MTDRDDGSPNRDDAERRRRELEEEDVTAEFGDWSLGGEPLELEDADVGAGLSAGGDVFEDEETLLSSPFSGDGEQDDADEGGDPPTVEVTEDEEVPHTEVPTGEVELERDRRTMLGEYGSEEETRTVELPPMGGERGPDVGEGGDGDTDVAAGRSQATHYGGFAEARRTEPPERDDEDLETVDFDVALSAEQVARAVDEERDLETHAGALGESREGSRGVDEETLAGAVESTGAGLEERRAEETHAGDFAGTRGAAPAEDEETVFDPSATERAAEAASKAATTPGPLPARGGTRGTGQGMSATARDPIAGTAAGRGTQPGARSGPVELREGNLIADRYELTRRLGKGGMGEVWAAKHILLQGMRAIKLIKASISRDPEFRKRFLAEGQAMMRVKHPYVVEVTDLDETRSGRELFMVMEHLTGRPLYDAIRDTDDPISRDHRELVRVFKEIAIGMHRIHEESIVHKDLKSDNVFLTRDDEGHEHPKVIDFGLAKRVDSPDKQFDPDDPEAEPQGYDPDLRTTLSGTLAYMAPEQFQGRPSSFQSDIYAFGVMLHEAFMDGEYPLPRGGLAHYLELHTQGATPEWLKTRAPDLDPYLAELTDRCMALRKEDRPESFEQVADELQWWLDIPVRRARRNRILAISGAFAAVLLIAVGIAMFGGESKSTITAMDVRVARQVRDPVGEGDPESRIVFLNAPLTAVELTGRVENGVREAEVLLDGEPLPFEDQSDGETLRLVVDFSGAADGHHELVVTAEDGGPERRQLVHIDREAPEILKASVEGVRGSFTNVSSPTVVVDAQDGNEHGLKLVEGRIAGGDRVAAELDSGAPYSLRLPLTGDGPVDLVVVVEDLAGNRSQSRLSFVRDTELEEWTPDLLEKERDGEKIQLLQVREPAGNELTVTVGEPGTLVATFDDLRVEQEVPQAGPATVPVPDVSVAGYDATITFADRAGNEGAVEFRVEQTLDVARVTGQVEAVSGDDPLELRLLRSYPISGRVGFVAHPLRDASGSAVRSGTHRELSGVQLQQVTPYECQVTFRPDELADGHWRIEPVGLGPAAVDGFELTIDRVRPSVGEIVVRDGRGAVIDAGKWGNTQDLVFEVTVADQSLQSLTLEGEAPDSAVEPGERTYRFRRTLAQGQEQGSFTLAAADVAGNTTSRAIEFRSDWTRPAIESVRLVPKADGSRYGTNESAVFELRLSETPVDVTLRTPFGDTFPVSYQTGDVVRFERVLPTNPADSEQPYAVVFQATDPAGNRSVEQTVSVVIEQRRVELEKVIAWRDGVNTTMHLAQKGDVLIGQNLFPVADVYVDETEVTNEQYRAFLQAVAGRSDHPWRHPDQPADWDHTPPAETWADPSFSRPDQPVVNVAFWDAWAFANWSGRRLPYEAEWTLAAAKEKERAKLREFPPVEVGREPDASLIVVGGGDGARPVSAVTGSDVSPIGCLHMGGNVSEWVIRTDPEAIETPTAYCVAGGNYFFSSRAANVRDVRAKPYDRSTRASTIGFRTVVDAERTSAGGGR